MSRSSNSKSRLVGPLILIGGGLALLIGTLVFALALTGPSTTATPPAQSVEDTYPEIPRVSLADARIAFDTKSAIFVDVRDDNSYAAGHIPAALSIPLAELPDRLDELERSDWIITYCT